MAGTSFRTLWMSYHLHKYKEFQYVLIVLKLHPLEVGSELVHPRTCSYGLVNKVNKCFYEQTSHTWSTDPTVISSFTAITVSSSSRLCGGVTTCMMRGSVGKCAYFLESGSFKQQDCSLSEL